jgi:hypothetical protein
MFRSFKTLTRCSHLERRSLILYTSSISNRDVADSNWMPPDVSFFAPSNDDRRANAQEPAEPTSETPSMSHTSSSPYPQSTMSRKKAIDPEPQLTNPFPTGNIEWHVPSFHDSQRSTASDHSKLHFEFHDRELKTSTPEIYETKGSTQLKHSPPFLLQTAHSSSGDIIPLKEHHTFCQSDEQPKRGNTS